MNVPLADRFRTILLLRVAEAEKLVADLAEGACTSESLEQAMGVLHTLKGESRMLGLMALFEAATDMEQRLLTAGAHDSDAMPSIASAVQVNLARIAAALGPGLTAAERDDLLRRSSTTPPQRARRHRVLVVDDSPIVCELVSELLRGEGLEVQTAHDGAEALAVLEAAAPDLVLSDVEMPSMDGFSLLEHARRRAKDLPFVLLTTRCTPQDRSRAATLGANAYLVKSDFENGILLETVGRLLDRSW